MNDLERIAIALENIEFYLRVIAYGNGNTSTKVFSQFTNGNPPHHRERNK